MKPAFRSLVFFDASSHPRVVLTCLTAPGPRPLCSAGRRGDSPKEPGLETRPKLQNRSRMSRTQDRRLRPNFSNPAAPRGRCHPPGPAFSSCIPLAAGWERLGLSSLLPGRSSASLRPGAADTGTPAPGSPSPGWARAAPRGPAAVGIRAPARGGLWLRGQAPADPSGRAASLCADPRGRGRAHGCCVRGHAGSRDPPSPSAPRRGSPFPGRT